MINEKLEKLNQEIAKGEARLRRAQSKGATIHRSSRCVAPCRGLPAESG